MKIPWNFTNNILTITLLRRTTNFIKRQNDRGSVRNIFAVSLLVFSVFAIVAFAYPSKLLLAQNAPTPTPQQTAFVNSFQKLVGDANNLTQSYQSEVTKWKNHQLDNKTMISVTDNYLPRYEKFINQSKTLQSPAEFQNATNSYTRSLESETSKQYAFQELFLDK